MSKPFAVFDLDGTLIRWQLYHAITDGLVKAGYADPQAFIPVKEARMNWKRRETNDAFSEYEKYLIDAFEDILMNLAPEQLEEVTVEIFEEYKDQVYSYTRDLIKLLKDKGYFLLAISGSQIEIVGKIAQYYGFDDCVGTVYQQENGKFTGQKIIGSADKANTLKELMARHGLDFSGSIAVGDSASDISMLQMVQKPVAFNPEKALYEAATLGKWKIVLERKNMIYELEVKDGNYQLVKTNAG
jgi:HAD superfamily hydrolase (TIGR01490 family)